MQIRQVYIVCPGEEGYSQFLTKKAHFLLRENKTTRVHVISWINLVSLPVSKTLLRSGIEPRSPTGSRRITKKQWISACKDWYTCNYINEKCYDYITIKHVDIFFLVWSGQCHFYIIQKQISCDKPNYIEYYLRRV